MLTSDSFLVEIEAFLKRADMSATAFGVAAVRDPNFVKDLRDGRAPSLRLVERVHEFIHKHAPSSPSNVSEGASS